MCSTNWKSLALGRAGLAGKVLGPAWFSSRIPRAALPRYTHTPSALPSQMPIGISPALPFLCLAVGPRVSISAHPSVAGPLYSPSRELWVEVRVATAAMRAVSVRKTPC